MPLFDSFWRRSNRDERTMPQPVQTVFQREAVTNRNIKDSDGYYPIICPHCLKSFKIWEVEFRAGGDGIERSSVTDSQTTRVDSRRNRSLLNQEPDLDDMTTALETENGFYKETDKKYKEFRDRYHLPDGIRHQNKVLRMFDDEGNPTGEIEQIYLMDEDGTQIREPIYLKGTNAYDPSTPYYHKPIYSIVDKFGKPEMDRVCPHCHNRVLREFGIRPHYIICVVGNTKIGKTVFLEKISTELRRPVLRNISAQTITVGETRHETVNLDNILQGGSALAATPLEYVPPRCFQFNGVENNPLITMFDFPGEALEHDRTDLAAFTAHYSNVIREVDAFIFGFDCQSFQLINEIQLDSMPEFVPNEYQVEGYQTPYDVLNRFRLNMMGAESERFNKPVAFAVTKADVIRDLWEGILEQVEDPSYFSSAVPGYLQEHSYRDDEMLNLSMIQHNSNEIDTLLNALGDDGKDIAYAAPTSLTNNQYAWFTFSAFGTQTIEKQIEGSDRMRTISQGRRAAFRTLDPLFWIMYMLGLIEGEWDDASEVNEAWQ